MARDPSRPRRRFPWLWLNVAACAAWLAVPGIRKSLSDETCPKEMHVLLGAMQMYLLDSDMNLPLAQHWADDLLPYAGSKHPYACPDLDNPSPASFGHALPSAMSGVNIAKEADLSSVGVLFDSTDLTWNACGPIPPKLGERRNAAFLDGSVRPLTDSK